MIFFFNDTATTEIYTLSLHDALPIYSSRRWTLPAPKRAVAWMLCCSTTSSKRGRLEERSEEHTSELQSLTNLVCRLLLEKKNKSTYSKKHTPPICSTVTPHHHQVSRT